MEQFGKPRVTAGLPHGISHEKKLKSIIKEDNQSIKTTNEKT